MVQKYLFSFLSSIFFIGLTFTIPAQAGYNGDTQEVTVLEDSTSLFPRNGYTVEFFNYPHISETKFTLRLASYGEVSGCAEMSEADLEIKEVMDKIDLTVTDSELTLDDYPRFTNYDCDIKRNGSFFDVLLDRDELIEKGIKHIALKSETYGEFATSDIDVNKYRIELSVKAPNGTYMKTFWFFPENSIILHAPHAKAGQDVQKAIREFGVSQGLIPMEDNLSEFELPYDARSHVFFIDPNKNIAEELIAPGENVTVGEITVTRTAYGPNGPVDEPYNLEVFATLPGQHY